MKPRETLKLVSFHPEKRRHLAIGDLAKQILVAKKQRVVTFYEKILLKERHKIMRRLYHIGYGTSKIYDFPLSIRMNTRKDGVKVGGKYGKTYIAELTVLPLYRQLATELNSQGFVAKVNIEKKKHESGIYYYTTLTVVGVRE